MVQHYPLKIDSFCHIIPIKYKEALEKLAQPQINIQDHYRNVPASLWDLDLRFSIMDRYNGLSQVLTLSSPPIESVVSREKSAALAKLANDEMAELVSKFPFRFAAAIACLPMNNMKEALKEVDRCIQQLKMRGVQIFTPINDKPLDSPEFIPLYEKMEEYNLPIWIHPTRASDFADYKTENRSLYESFGIFGWPYETTVAMSRLVFSGILEKFPKIKFITHHCGGMLPHFWQRLAHLCDYTEMMRHDTIKERLTKPPIEYFKAFYTDTALYGNASGIKCGYDFFGADHLLFGTDMPHDNHYGDRLLRDTINAIEESGIDDSDKKKIYEDNARLIMRLPI